MDPKSVNKSPQMMKEKLLTGRYTVAIIQEEESYPEVMDILKKFMI